MTSARQAAEETIARSPCDEGAIVRRIAAGDELAFEVMMRRHNSRLFRLARATLRNREDAEDALQETYLQAWRAMPSFRGDASLFTWLSRLLLNECYARMRKHARRQRIMPIDALIPEDADIGAYSEAATMVVQDPDLPPQAAARAELRAMLESCLDGLPQTYRTVFVLRAVEEMTVEETAQCLQIPEATVRSRHFRASALLRTALAGDVDLAARNPFEFCGADCDRVVTAVLARLKTEGEGRGLQR
jgi:RNA polymerase sigma-70 factor (ECF subfamily)